MPSGIPKNGINKGWFKKGEVRTPTSNETRKKISLARKGKKLSEETKKKISLAKKGTTPWNKGIPNTWSKGFEKGNVPWNVGTTGIMPSGKLHIQWKGGKPKCQDCGKQLKTYGLKKCQKCYLLYAKKENHSCWKGGINSVIKRRATIVNAKGSHTIQEWEDLKKKYNNMCLCCKIQEPFIKLTEDHIVPLSVGGSNYISNIQPLCRSCNARKYTKTINFINKYEKIER